MTVLLSHAADIVLRTMGEEDQRKVHAWLDRLNNWENDELVRSKSRRLDVPDTSNVYVLRSSTDIRLFFTLEAHRIEVIDIARSDSLRIVGQAS